MLSCSVIVQGVQSESTLEQSSIPMSEGNNNFKTKQKPAVLLFCKLLGAVVDKLLRKKAA